MIFQLKNSRKPKKPNETELAKVEYIIKESGA